VPVDPGAPLRLLLTSFGAGVPHFVRVTTWDSLIINPGNLYPAVAAVSAHFARQGKACLDDLLTAEVGTSDQRNHARGRDGRCGSPLYPLLVRARLPVDRSDDRTSLRRSKVFPSLAGSRLSTAPCFGRHSLDPATRGSTQIPYGPWGQAAPFQLTRSRTTANGITDGSSGLADRPTAPARPTETTRRDIPATREELAGGHLAGG
jgi:hypothetical protein